MAIELDDRITILETKDFKARFKTACKAQGTDPSIVLRTYERSFTESWEATQTAPVQPN